MSRSITFLLVSCLFSFVLGHGKVTSPTPRTYGSASLAACGTGVTNELKSDAYGPIEFALPKIDSGYNATACNLFLCRSYKIADNVANTRVYKTGTVVNFIIDIEAHHTGYANVSVIDLQAQKPIGAPLINWPVYANSSLAPADWPVNQTNFNVVVPNLGTSCSTSGACALHWWWYAPGNKQTYANCIDFTQ